jgi:hypothetical protein
MRLHISEFLKIKTEADSLPVSATPAYPLSTKEAARKKPTSNEPI